VRARIVPGHQLAVNLGDSMSQRFEVSSASRQGNQYTVARLISRLKCAACPAPDSRLNLLSARAINLLTIGVDKAQVLGGSKFSEMGDPAPEREAYTKCGWYLNCSGVMV